MAQNIIRIEFDPCEPTPALGYFVKYRPVGSLEDYRIVSPNPTDSPVVIVDDNDPAGTSYEGTIQGHCGVDNYSLPVPWEALNGDSVSESQASESESDVEPPVEEWDYYLADELLCEDCFGVPVQENVLIRIPTGTVINVGKYYRPAAHPNGLVYQILPTPQAPGMSITMSVLNFTNCAGACAG